MLKSLRPYGSVRSFAWHGPGAALAGVLSGFLPEDEYDRQPLLDESHADSSGPAWVMVADVRLDNRASLIHTLHLTTPEVLADSSILLAAWLRWGPDCLDRLVGSFAFAVWNPRDNTLFAARDATGDRPLFFHRGKDCFAFASVPGALLRLPGVNRGVNEDTVLASLILARAPQDQSFFAGIERLPPGHCLTVTGRDVRVEAWWRPFQAPTPRFRRNSDYAEAFLELFDAAVSARLRSTGAIGSQLSSGLDSSSVTVSAALELARRGQRLTSFTAVPRPGFRGTGWHGRLADEGPGAARVAGAYGNIDHVLIDSAGQDMVKVLTRLTDAVDEPVPNVVNSLWMNAILDAAAARGISTLLVGVRGNLTFSHAGLEALGQMLRRGQWLRLARTAHSFRRKGLVSLRASATRALAGLLPDAWYRGLSGAGTFELDYSAVNPQLARELGLKDRMLAQFFTNRHDLKADRLDLLHSYDVDLYNAAYQATHQIDVRDPSADRRVMEFCFALPIEQYVAEGVPRSLVRRSMRGRLPTATLTNTRRGQQGADWYLAVADALPDLRTQMALNRQSPAACRLLGLDRMDSLLASWPDPEVGEDLDRQHTGVAYGDALCRGFSYGYFLRSHERASTL